MKKLAFILLLSLFSWPICALAQLRDPMHHNMDDTLSTIVVTAQKEKLRNTTQTGLVHLDPSILKRGAVSFGTPDIIKTLLTLPGVSAGNELMGGMYVHGGDGTDNLYLLDGVPLYNISHFGGIFSSFNTDVVDGLDFYKSGFPARYGGKLSSVVDVETATGDMQRYHGSFSLGLIDGRLNIQGPIIKGKTSFNIAYRRSWMDMMIALAMKLYKGDKPRKAAYFMNDLNAGITHHFAPDNVLKANFFWGSDKLDLGITRDDMAMDMAVDWGNLTSSIQWNRKASRKFRHNHSLFYTQSTSNTDYGIKMSMNSLSDVINSGIRNIGLRNGVDWYPNDNHHVRAGLDGDFKMYAYVGQALDPSDPASPSPTLNYKGGELTAYMEDEFFILPVLTLNLGLRYSAYLCRNKVWHSFEPRVALKWAPFYFMDVKASYTRMSQADHLVASTYMDMPSNTWMPSTASIRPVESDQFSGGLYFTPLQGMKFNIEGWYRTMNHLLHYIGPNAMIPPVQNWETSFADGRGKSYGLETELSWSNDKISATAYYTLSWSLRRFDAVYPQWFHANNDNRHKLNLLFSYKIAKSFEIYADWNYHTGNRVTLPASVSADGAMFYGEPFNFSLPDYHRMDVGLNYTWFFRGSQSLELNASIYNLYNNKNAFVAFVRKDESGNFKGTAYSVLPVFPTLSLTYKF